MEWNLKSIASWLCARIQNSGAPDAGDVDEDEDMAAVTIDERGTGRKLRSDDFGPGRIDGFSTGDLGRNWSDVDANSAYRLNQFMVGLRNAGRRYKITSSARSREQNTDAGGAANSLHLVGDDRGAGDEGARAFDVWIFDDRFFERLGYYVELARERAGFNAVGLYEGKTLIHVDTRAGAPAGWGSKVRDGKRIFVSLATAVREFPPGGDGTVLVAAGALLVFFLAT